MQKFLHVRGAVQKFQEVQGCCAKISWGARMLFKNFWMCGDAVQKFQKLWFFEWKLYFSRIFFTFLLELSPKNCDIICQDIFGVSQNCTGVKSWFFYIFDDFLPIFWREKCTIFWRENV